MAGGFKKHSVLFSRGWLENYWYYYKKFIIIGAVLLISIMGLLAECVLKTQPDFTMTYIGGIMNMGQVESYRLEDMLGPSSADINGDGKHVAKINVIYLSEKKQSEEMGSMYQMAYAEMAAGDSVVFLFDEQYLNFFADAGSDFYDLTEMTTRYGIDQSLLKRGANGHVYAMELKSNRFFTEIEGIVPDGLYMAVRPMRENDKSAWQKANYQNGRQMAEYIISQGKSKP